MSKLLPLLVAGTGLSEPDIIRIVSNAPLRYKSYRIPKRRGGNRTISQPARELKVLQRILTEEFLSKLPVHQSATAYRAGTSIKHNALAHALNGPILKFDFANFFPSIGARDWTVYCEREGLMLEARDIWISSNIFFHRWSRQGRLSLAIGAPSSPCLSNVLMNEFDEKIANAVASDQVTYTRYADDLAFSAKRTGYLNQVEKILRRTIKEIKFPNLTLNESKTILATKKYKRFVTGLTLTNDGKVSLGRERKRKIRAALKHYADDRLNIHEQAKLAGLISFAHDVERDFVLRMERTYGSELLQALKLVRLPSTRGGGGGGVEFDSDVSDASDPDDDF
ncbi:RNA-directed DNA polymerase [Bradyrhizobium hipponense]|uniref:RNA-directed DNA polymerase n=1 Tax=Bradyrhizobium hipponense TaxID=2605638 RepID=A0A5S4YGW7_9BRAD|nr:retron St85 family RNA-directed DNA polymerase [Bradyrhizobium hipponense]TYO63636.1 RNA-directed DNA polymerase [Bradyrhizobium hipponense]